MRDFTSLYTTLLKSLLPHILNKSHVRSHLEYNTANNFSAIIKKYIGVAVHIAQYQFNNNFPLLAGVFVRAKIGDRVVSAGATEVRSTRGKNLAYVKSQGEFLERLSSFLPLDLFRMCAYDVRKTVRHSPQFIQAGKLFALGHAKLPASYIYFGLKKYTPSEKYEPTTNGGAGHFDYKTAVLSGLLELIQRDAFFVYWLNTISPKRIDIDPYIEKGADTSPEFQELSKLVSDFKRYNLEYFFLDITTDIAVPAVCCVLVSDSPSGKRVFVGASAGFATSQTLLSSATEATSVANGHYFKKPFVLDAHYVPFTEKSIGRDARMDIYVTDFMYEKIRFFIENPESVSVEDWSTAEGRISTAGFSMERLSKNPKYALSYLKKIFTARCADNPDYEVLVYNIKNTLLTHFGYTVARVFCKALYPIYLTESYADPDHPRLREFVFAKGLQSVARINPWPHPFP